MTEHELIFQIQFARDGLGALHELWLQLELAPLFDVPAKAGEATWQGPTPDAFAESIRSACDRLQGTLDAIAAEARDVPFRIAELERQLADVRAAQQAALLAALTE